MDRPPVWLMRQAGRYLPEYMALRARHEFWELMRDPVLATEVALQPLRRYSLDAAILFSDILVPFDAAGIRVTYGPRGPALASGFLEAPERVSRMLEAYDPARDAGYVQEAMAKLVDSVAGSVAVIGFAGAPLTMAAYLVEGGPSRDLRGLKRLWYRDPGLARELLGTMARLVARHLQAQVDAGAQVLQLFDSWAIHVPPWDYRDLAVPALAEVLELVGTATPVILYIRGAASHLPAVAHLPVDVVSVDSTLELLQARRALPEEISVQGNLDPAELMGPEERIRKRTWAMIRQAGARGYIVNLGQGLVPDVPPEGVAAMVDAVLAYEAPSDIPGAP